MTIRAAADLPVASSRPVEPAGSEDKPSAEQPVEPEVRPRRYSRGTWALTILASLAIIAALYLGRAFFVPLLIGIFASYSLRPLVDWLRRLHIPQGIGAALVIAALIGGFSWIGYALADQTTAMIEKLPEAARKLRFTLSSSRASVPSALQNVQEAADELQKAASDVGAKSGKPAAAAAPAPGDPTAWLRDYAMEQSALLLSIAAKTPIVLLLAYFLLASGDHFRRKMLQFAGPTLSQKKDVVRILEEVDSQIQHYLLVMLISNALVGLGTWIALEAMGIDQAGVWGVFAGVMHFIPYLGPVIIAFGAGVAGFLQFGTILEALSVAGVTLLVAGLIGMVFMTWLQSRVAHVNAAVLFIALLFFAWMWGVAGILLGGPIVAIVRVVCDRIDPLKPVAELLS